MHWESLNFTRKTISAKLEGMTVPLLEESPSVPLSLPLSVSLSFSPILLTPSCYSFSPILLTSSCYSFSPIFLTHFFSSHRYYSFILSPSSLLLSPSLIHLFPFFFSQPSYSVLPLSSFLLLYSSPIFPTSSAYCLFSPFFLTHSSPILFPPFFSLSSSSSILFTPLFSHPSCSFLLFQLLPFFLFKILFSLRSLYESSEALHPVRRPGDRCRYRGRGEESEWRPGSSAHRYILLYILWRTYYTVRFISYYILSYHKYIVSYCTSCECSSSPIESCWHILTISYLIVCYLILFYCDRFIFVFKHFFLFYFIQT